MLINVFSPKKPKNFWRYGLISFYNNKLQPCASHKGTPKEEAPSQQHHEQQRTSSAKDGEAPAVEKMVAAFLKPLLEHAEKQHTGNNEQCQEEGKHRGVRGHLTNAQRIRFKRTTGPFIIFYSIYSSLYTSMTESAL